MTLANRTGFTPSSFILIGIPGLEDFHPVFAAPLCGVYIVTVLGNSTLLLAIKTGRSLQQPMYFLIALLCCSDLVLSSSILPKMLALFWFKAEQIPFNACLVQMFLIHTFASVESGILSAMAFDRYVAVCNPLRYPSIVANSLIGKLALAILIRAGSLTTALPLITHRLPFCTRYIAHSFCEHIAVAKLSCADVTVNNLYGLAASLSIAAMDFPCIGVSYTQIIRSVLRLPKGDRRKAFSTCVAHVSVMSIFYVPIVFSLALHRLHNSIPLSVHIIVVTCYLLIPPVANPLIYGAKMKEIRKAVLQMLPLGKT
ncbi:olfactory receptor 52J3-like [Ambystoma mexicanum]|uniref:olfactory receptor 52J3-like n=1 Tax=Ambystoma mexicanum TaxID=8296 RepID=UPI0037E7F5F4